MTAEPLVLVPGLNLTGDLYALQIAALSPERPIRVAETTRDPDIPAMARRLLADNPGRFALAGLSMGGYVALEVMRQAPDRVTRLGLLDTSARPDSAEAGENRRRLIALAESGRFEEVLPILWERLVAPERRGDAALEERVRAMAQAVGPQAFVAQQLAIMSRPDQRPHLPEIEVPTLVLVGDQDAITPPELSREIADAIEWASLVVVPDCGHLSTLERPEAVTAALKAWLAAKE